MDKLYIDNKQVEMGGEVGIYLTYRSNIMSPDISKILGNNSNTIKIPHTLHNASIIDNAQMVTSATNFPYLQHTADVERDGVMIIRRATVILLKTTPKEYEISLVWGVSEGLRQMAGKDEKLPVLWDHADGTYDPMIWTFYGYGTYRMPEAMYGFVRSAQNGKFGFHPVMSIRDILNLMEDRYGTRFVVPGLGVHYRMSEYVIPILRGNTPPVVVNMSGKGTSGEWWSNISSTPYTGVNGGGNIVILKNDVKLTRLEITYKTAYYAGGSSSGSSDMDMVYDTYYISVIHHTATEMDDGTTETDETEIAEIPVSNIEYLGFSQTGPEDDAHEYEITFSAIIDDDIATFKEGDIILMRMERRPINGTSSPPVLPPTNRRGGTGRMTFQQGSVMLGDTYYLSLNLPDIEVVKWFKGVMQMLGVFPLLRDDGTFLLLDYPTFFSRKAEARDWSGYLCMTATDASEDQEFAPEGFYQRNTVEYKDDDANKNMNSSFLVANDTLEAEGTYIELPFSSVDKITYASEATAERFSQMAVIPMYEQKNEDAENWNPITERVSGEEGKAFILWRRMDTQGDWYLSREGLDWGTLLETSYQGIIQSVQQAHYITATFYLDAVTLQRVDFGYPIYIQQYASYFAIIEIKTKANNLAEVKLLKLV